jgi:hypothetical protein
LKKLKIDYFYLQNNQYNMVLTVSKMVYMYMVLYILHIIAAHLYVHYCVPLTLHGMLMAPLLTTASHCVILRWTIINGGNVPMVGWGMVIVWLGQFVIQKRQV